MKSLAWYQSGEDERRVSVAQTFVWMSCAGTLVGLVVAVVASLLGRIDIWPVLAKHPFRAISTLVMLALYVTAGFLIGERRPSGGLLGLTLFAYSIATHAVSGRFMTWSTAWALVGVFLILRAGRAIKLPFISTVGS